MWFDELVAMKKKSGKTTLQISVESGIPIGTLNKLFAGQTKDPKLGTLRAVVHTLGYTLDDLVPLAEQKEKPVEDELFDILRRNYDLLNREGQEILVNTSTGLVASGAYIKTGAFELGREA